MTTLFVIIDLLALNILHPVFILYISSLAAHMQLVLHTNITPLQGHVYMLLCCSETSHSLLQQATCSTSQHAEETDTTEQSQPSQSTAQDLAVQV